MFIQSSMTRTTAACIVAGTIALAPTQVRARVPPPRPVGIDEAPSATVRTCFVGGRDVCRPRIIGGSVSLGLGIAALGAGVALTIPKSTRVPGEPAYERAYLPAGLVLIGAALQLVTMGGMLIGDAVQRKRGARARFAWRMR